MTVRGRWTRRGRSIRTRLAPDDVVAPVPEPPWPSRPVFRDPESDQRFRADGFVVVPFLSSLEVADLVRIFDDLGPPQGEADYHHELWGLDGDRKDHVAAALRPTVERALDAVLVDYVARTHAFIRKRPGPSTAVPPHVDISFVEEALHRSVMVWCSLSGHRPGDGILHIVAGSQRLRPGVRAHGDDASSFPDLVEDIEGGWGTPVPLEPGSAVIFDHGTVHYAEPNLGSEARLTVQCVCTPLEAQLLYPVPSAHGRARVLAVDDAFYRGFSLDGHPDEALLGGYRVIDEVDVPTERLVRSQFAELRGGSAPPRPSAGVGGAPNSAAPSDVKDSR